MERGDLRRDEQGQEESTPSSSNYNINNDNDNMRNLGGIHTMPLIREMKKYLQPKSLFLPINLFPILELLGKLITAKDGLP